MNLEVIKIKPIREVSGQDLRPQILLLVGWAFKFMGYGKRMNEREMTEEIDFITKAFTGVLLTDYPALKLVDVSKAVQNGVKGKYGEFMGLSAATFTMFVNKYHAQQIEENRKLKTHVSLPEPEISEADKKKIIDEGIEATYRHFKATKTILDYGNATCKELIKRGEIVLPPERFAQVCEYAKRILEQGISTQINKCAIPKEVFELKERLRQFEVGNRQKEVESEAYNIILREYYLQKK